MVSKIQSIPKSIYQNVAYGLHPGYKKQTNSWSKSWGIPTKAALWEEVKDGNENAYGLSGGQQQRLCCPHSSSWTRDYLMDERHSALDPVATGRVEELILSLKNQCTIVVVTHNIRSWQNFWWDCFLCLGKLISATKRKLFSWIHPKNKPKTISLKVWVIVGTFKFIRPKHDDLHWKQPREQDQNSYSWGNFWLILFSLLWISLLEETRKSKDRTKKDEEINLEMT